MRFVVMITQDEDGMYVAECQSVPGCVSQGKSAQEAEVNIKEAIKECLEVRAERACRWSSRPVRSKSMSDASGPDSSPS